MTDIVVPLPVDPVNQVADGLWIGSHLAEPDPSRFEAVLTLHLSLTSAPAPIIEKRWHIQDAGLPDLDELHNATSFVFNHWALQARPTLVRCLGGLNRSGLVVATALIANCEEPEDAIAMVRAARGPYALCNPRFEQYLLSLGSLSDIL